MIRIFPQVQALSSRGASSSATTLNRHVCTDGSSQALAHTHATTNPCINMDAQHNIITFPHQRSGTTRLRRRSMDHFLSSSTSTSIAPRPLISKLYSHQLVPSTTTSISTCPSPTCPPTSTSTTTTASSTATTTTGSWGVLRQEKGQRCIIPDAKVNPGILYTGRFEVGGRIGGRGGVQVRSVTTATTTTATSGGNIDLGKIDIKEKWEARIARATSGKKEKQQETTDHDSLSSGASQQTQSDTSPDTPLRSTPIDTSTIPHPTKRQMSIHALHAAVPMVGFGLMDNTILIHAGDYIDQTVGVAFGMPTMVAAASGQILSDFSGVCFGGAIEAVALKLGLPPSKMTAEQFTLPTVKRVRTASAALGVVTGCTLAMGQIYFMDLHKGERLKAKKELVPLFHNIAMEAKTLLDCERVTLYVITNRSDKDKVVTNHLFGNKVLFSMGFFIDDPTEEDLKEAFTQIDINRDDMISFEEMDTALERIGVRNDKIRLKLRDLVQETFRDSQKILLPEFKILVRGILEIIGTEMSVYLDDAHEFLREAVVRGAEGQITNIQDHEEWHKVKSGQAPVRWRCFTGRKTKSVVVCPIIDKESGEVVGLLEAVNKNQGQYFDKEDERLVKAIASHAGSVLAQKDLLKMIYQDFDR